MKTNEFIGKLNSLGQSVWYDNLSRDVLRSGELKRVIDLGVTGLTSNPTIFSKAIGQSAAYDDQLREAKSANRSAEEVCEQLMVEDVGAAADLLREVYAASGGSDGFASIEVNPLLAYDTEATLQAARSLWNALNRPNVMVKVPATKEGLPAIEELLAEGINVNITLIFSPSRYREVADAYLRALHRRLEQRLPVEHVASVASFFVSRVDSICEKALKELGGDQAARAQRYAGKIGIANSKIAYLGFKEVFVSGAFEVLQRAGASVQRPLWASTSVKNPQFRPMMYIEELAAPNTVITLPPAALEALTHGAEISAQLSDADKDAQEIIEQLGKEGIDFWSLLEELERNGVQLFADSYRSMIEGVEAKMGDLS